MHVHLGWVGWEHSLLLLCLLLLLPTLLGGHGNEKLGLIARD